MSVGFLTFVLGPLHIIRRLLQSVSVGVIMPEKNTKYFYLCDNKDIQVIINQVHCLVFLVQSSFGDSNSVAYKYLRYSASHDATVGHLHCRSILIPFCRRDSAITTKADFKGVGVEHYGENRRLSEWFYR